MLGTLDWTEKYNIYCHDLNTPNKQQDRDIIVNRVSLINFPLVLEDIS